MKLPKPITGIIEKIGQVTRVKHGFSQAVIIRQKEVKNEQGYILSKEQYFVVSVYSNKENDSRFLKLEFVGAECAAEVYLDGERWQGKNGFQYNHRLNLDKWVTEETKK